MMCFLASSISCSVELFMFTRNTHKSFDSWKDSEIQRIFAQKWSFIWNSSLLAFSRVSGLQVLAFPLFTLEQALIRVSVTIAPANWVEIFAAPTMFTDQVARLVRLRWQNVDSSNNSQRKNCSDHFYFGLTQAMAEDWLITLFFSSASQSDSQTLRR